MIEEERFFVFFLYFNIRKMYFPLKYRVTNYDVFISHIFATIITKEKQNSEKNLKIFEKIVRKENLSWFSIFQQLKMYFPLKYQVTNCNLLVLHIFYRIIVNEKKNSKKNSKIFGKIDRKNDFS